MRASTSWAAALFLIGLGGCGGGGGGPRAPVTHSLEHGTPFAVPAGVCDAVSGPFSVGAGSMAFNVLDTPTGIGSDSMDLGIMFDSDFVASGCDFNLAIVHDVGPSASDSGPVYAGTYSFVVGCSNIIDDCLFSLTWTATY